MNLADAIAVFDKSADAQTEAWAVIRAELMRVLDAPLAMVEASDDYYAVLPTDGDSYIAIGKLSGKRVRLVREGG